tara:strand:+ start:422 stop:943 length:522 start_codon:yes stop_codon:yes gene_type:complete
MSNPQKVEIVNELTKRFKESNGIYLTKYTGMSVVQATELRKKFRENNVSYFISKNTLTKIAAKNAGYEDRLDDVLIGQLGIAYSHEDPTAPARVISDYEKENKNSTLEVVGLVFEGELYSAEKYKELAALPTRHELLGRLANVINQPMTKLAGTLNGAMSKLAMVLSSLKDTK